MRQTRLQTLTDWLRAFFVTPPSVQAADRIKDVENAESATSVSPWLYLGGLCVTLSGLYAVNFGLEDRAFAALTFGLATAGYLASYLLRVSKVSVRSLQTPLLVCVGLIVLAGLTSENGLSWFAPSGALEDRAVSLQIMIVWVGILHSFLLASDSAILFACVPGMTMIALVSTQTSEPQIQNAFVAFIASATFLMVHENYLRTRAAIVRGRSRMGERRLFGGQFQLAAICVVGAVVLANFVAVPIRAVGQTLFIPSLANPFNAALSKQKQNASNNVLLSENKSVEIAEGPQTESDIPVLLAHANRALYWRGATYDDYTGHSFESTTTVTETVHPEPAASDRGSEDFPYSYQGQNPNEIRHFSLPPGDLAIASGQMQGGQVEKQRFTVMGGAFMQLYGAGEARRVDAPFASINTNASGVLVLNASLPAGTVYDVESEVADETPDVLRAAASAPDALPEAIARLYLQTRNIDGQESSRLRVLAGAITRAATNNYDRATAIQQYVSSHCKYNLQTPASPKDQDKVEYFLFESRQGYCDNFAAAMTMLCRYAGVPARLASGFLSGDRGENGDFIVRQKHKHLWTEVFFPRIGWVPFDATDGAEDISRHAHSKTTQENGFAAWLLSHGALPPMLGLALLALGAYVVKTEILDRLRGRSRKERGRDTALRFNRGIGTAYAAGCAALARRGLTRSASATSHEFARRVCDVLEATDLNAANLFAELTALHTRFRYGPEAATEADVLRAHQIATTIAKLLAQTRREVSRRALEKAAGQV